MSMKLMALAMDVKVGSAMRKLVLLKLCDNANDKGECWPSFQHVADQCEISRRSVISHLQALEEMGFLRIIKRSKNGEQTSNLYKISLTGKDKISGAGISLPPSAGDSPGGATDSLPSATDSPGGSAGDSPRTSHSFESVNEPVSEPSKSPRRKFSENDFTTANYFFESILQTQPDFKKPNLSKWADTVRLMREQDNRSGGDILKVWTWARRHHFWHRNILSPDKLRQKFDQLKANMGGNPNAQSTQPSRPQNRCFADQQRDQARQALADLEARDCPAGDAAVYENGGPVRE